MTTTQQTARKAGFVCALSRSTRARPSPRSALRSALCSAPRRLAAALSVLASMIASAHETWLMPETFYPPANQATEILMTSGMSFPALNAGIDRLRLAEAVLLQDGERFSLVPAGANDEALTLSAIASAEVACAWVRLHPRVLEIKEEKVGHYLDEIGADEGARAVWNAQSTPRKWREAYGKLARSYLRTRQAGAASDANRMSNTSGGGTPCWREASDSRFEVLPLSDPTVLRVGDTLTIETLLDDAPIAGQGVNLRHESENSGSLFRSGTDGKLLLELQKTGRYMVYATHLRPVLDGSTSIDEANWESDFVTLTFEVRE